jgi:hypothetical protein
MNVTVELSEEIAAALAAQARAVRMPTEAYVAYILEQAIERQRSRAAEALDQHLHHMASQVRTDTTTEQMEAALEEALTAVRPRRIWRS